MVKSHKCLPKFYSDIGKESELKSNVRQLKEGSDRKSINIFDYGQKSNDPIEKASISLSWKSCYTQNVSWWKNWWRPLHKLYSSLLWSKMHHSPRPTCFHADYLESIIKNPRHYCRIFYCDNAIILRVRRCKFLYPWTWCSELVYFALTSSKLIPMNTVCIFWVRLSLSMSLSRSNEQFQFRPLEGIAKGVKNQTVQGKIPRERKASFGQT